MKLLSSLFFLFLPLWTLAQRIEPLTAFRAAGDRYIRFHYENDFLSSAKTDYYYTQGYSLEVATPVLRKNPLSRLLIHYKNVPGTYGLAFEHLGFTPTSISSNEPLVGDRPFAGVILLKTFVSSVDTLRHQRLSSALSTGMIGPAAFAGRMQATIHRWSGDQQPRGWQYQVGNDVVLNYDVFYEKELVPRAGIVALSTHVLVRVGTLSDKVQAGATVMAGRFTSPFSVKAPKRAFQIFVYAQPLASLIAYDATLQGGLFNRRNPYILPASQLRRFTFQANAGIVARLGKVSLTFYRSYLSPEFKTGRKHSWGGINIGIGF